MLLNRLFLGLAIGILLGAGVQAAKPANYNPDTLAFGPNGERGDLSLSFRPDFLKKFEANLKDPTLIVWFTEFGACHDKQPDCSKSASKLPHCRLAVERPGLPSEPLLVAKKNYGNLVNQNYGMQTKVQDGLVRTEGIYSHNWRWLDSTSRTLLSLECRPGEGAKDSAFTKNVFNRITGDVFQYNLIFTDPEAVPDVPKADGSKKSEAPREHRE
jgi:hypothetical protein